MLSVYEDKDLIDIGLGWAHNRASWRCVDQAAPSKERPMQSTAGSVGLWKTTALVAAALTAGAVAATRAAAPEGPAERPNVILVLTDDKY